MKMSELAEFSVTLKRHVAGTTIPGTRSLKVRRGTLGAALNKAEMKEYGLSLMSIELRLGGPNGSLIADDANVWTGIGGNTNTEIFFTGLTVKAQCKTLSNIN